MKVFLKTHMFCDVTLCCRARGSLRSEWRPLLFDGDITIV